MRVRPTRGSSPGVLDAAPSATCPHWTTGPVPRGDVSVRVQIGPAAYGALVRRARPSRGLTQVELARIVGIEQPSLSAYGNHRQMPSADLLHRFLAGCGYLLEATAGDRRLVCPLPGSRHTSASGTRVGQEAPIPFGGSATKPPGPDDERSALKLGQVPALADAFRRSRAGS